jgi:hypothetical protein
MGLKWAYNRGHGLLSCQEFDNSPSGSCQGFDYSAPRSCQKIPTQVPASGKNLPTLFHLGLLWPFFLA